MKAIVITLTAIAVISFIAALAGFWWQGIICGISALTAYVIDCEIEKEEKAAEAKSITRK